MVKGSLQRSLAGSILVVVFILGLLLTVGLQSADASSYSLESLSDTYEFRSMEFRDLRRGDADSEAQATWGEIEYDGAGNWSTEADTLDGSGNISAENRSGTYALVGGETFALQDDVSGVPAINLAVSPDTDVTIGIKADTNEKAVNELFLGTERHTSFKSTEPGTVAGGTYNIAFIRYLNSMGSLARSTVLAGTAAFTRDGSVPAVFRTYRSDNVKGLSPSSNPYSVDEGDTVALGGGSNVNLAFTPDTDVFVGIQKSAGMITFQGVIMATRKPDTKPKVSDLSGTYSVRGLEFRDFEDRDGKQDAFSVWGKMVFDGKGNWQTQGFRKYSSSDNLTNETLSGTYAVSSSDTLFRFKVHPDTPGTGEPPYVLSLEPDTQAFVAYQADTNTTGSGFAQQSLLAGVRALPQSDTSPGGSNGSSGGGGGCVLEQTIDNSTVIGALRDFRDRLLRSSAGRLFTRYYYRFQ